MRQVLVFGAAAAVPVVVIYRSRRRKDPFAGHPNRGAFMRDLNGKAKKH